MAVVVVVGVVIVVAAQERIELLWCLTSTFAMLGDDNKRMVKDDDRDYFSIFICF